MKQRVTTAFASLALIGLLGACGGDDGSGDGGAGTSPDEIADAAVEFAECMREQGIDMPDPEISEDGVQVGSAADAGTPEEMEAAHAECDPIMEEVGANEPGDPAEVAEMRDQWVESAQCMRDRGYDFPDPEIDDKGLPTSGPPQPEAGADPDEFDADMQECHVEAGLEEDGPGAGEGDE